MSQLALITPIGGGHPDQGLPDQSLPPQIWPPDSLPPLPPGVWPNPPVGVWPPQRPPHVSGGPVLPPAIPTHPIVLPPVGPDNSLPMPPATVWPPLPPGTGVAGKALILIWVVGVGYRWLVVGATDVWPPEPPSAQPK
jgi:hypothetical protein